MALNSQRFECTLISAGMLKAAKSVLKPDSAQALPSHSPHRTPHVCSYFLDGKWEADLNTDNPFGTKAGPWLHTAFRCASLSAHRLHYLALEYCVCTSESGGYVSSEPPSPKTCPLPCALGHEGISAPPALRRTSRGRP